MANCPCGSGSEFTGCCEPIIKGSKLAPTAESLMRARYAAYTTGDIDFIVDSTHADHRSDMDVKEITSWSEQSKWLGLEIVETEEGQESDDTGMVEFKANFEIGDQSLSHHEKSTFSKVDGAWLFVDGQPVQTPIKRAGAKVGRNDPCSCGSGKKFKKCCGKN
ncbi:MAG: hypothetical protein BM556_12980 [Bacteriovorax sp. MedPE-SWde]|nr:MAG: hypothetical protein BM556_12980 [Bacteriovorax sp. MedPE-SWde]